MFKNIHFNTRSNKITLWETFNGKTVKVVEDLEYKYYTRPDDGEPSTAVDIYGRPVSERVSRNIYDLKEKTKLYKTIPGFYSSETDIDPEIKFLQSRYQDAELRPDINDFNVGYFDIEIEAESEFPRPEEAKFPINLITFYSTKSKKITTFGNRDYIGFENSEVQEYHYCANEKQLMISFVSWFRKQHFDIITGWNSSMFDVPYILNRMVNLFGEDHELIQKMSPIDKVRKKFNGEWEISGLTHLDYIPLYKNFTFEMEESYSLQSISMKILKKGKIDLDGSINTIYKTDWKKFVDYNIQDVMLVKEINDEKKFIELALTFCSQALIPIDRLFSSIATIEGFILRYLHKHGMVMTDRPGKTPDWWVEDVMYKTKLKDGSTYIQNREEDTQDGRGYPPADYVKGGHVKAVPGIYNNCLSFDVTSLYPHMIIQYNISPETKVVRPSEEEKKNLIESEINGVYYKKDKVGVLPSIVKSIFDERKYFKDLMSISENLEDGEDLETIFKKTRVSRELFTKYMEDLKKFNATSSYFYDRQLIDKILINSIYGVLINDYFHFYDLDNARCVTRGGRVLIRYLSDNTESYLADHFHKSAHKLFPNTKADRNPLGQSLYVPLNDTDSLYLTLDKVKQKYAPEMGLMEFAKIIEPFIEDFYKKILKIKADQKNMEQVINFKREGIISKQLILAKKKYISILLQQEKKVFDVPYMKSTGIDIRRSDTPKFCKTRIKECIENIFELEDREANLSIIKEIYKEFKTQNFEDIANNGAVKEYTKYAQDIGYYLKTGLKFSGKTPMRNKASIVYNYVVHTNKLPLQKIGNGTKVKLIRTKPRNSYGAEAIAWIGNYPKEFSGMFEPDYDTQFDVTFLSLIEKIWKIYGWIGETESLFAILTKNNKLSKFIE